MDPIKALMLKQIGSVSTSDTSQVTQASQPAIGTTKKSGRPVLPPDIQQYFVPPRGPQSGNSLLYKPAVMGVTQVHFTDVKTGIDTQEDNTFITDITEDNANSNISWCHAPRRIYWEGKPLAPAQSAEQQLQHAEPAAL